MNPEPDTTYSQSARILEHAPRMLDVMEVLLGYAESKESDGGKRPLAHMHEAREILRAVRGA